MTTDDLTFLLIFIVLPTVVIVSGFWAVLFVRRSPDRESGSPRKRRRRRATSTTGEEQAPAASPAVEASETDRPATSAAADRAVSTAIHVPAVIPANDADQPDDSDNTLDEESEQDSLPKVSDEQGQSQATSPGYPASDDELLDQATAEMPAVGQDADAEWDTRETTESTEPERPGGDDSQVDEQKPTTAELSEPAQDEDRENGSGEEPGPKPGKERPARHTRSATRLMPGDESRSRSTRRGRNTGRQVPRLGRRSNRRNKDGMERGDGPSDL